MKQEFKAMIKQHENKNAAYVEPPFDANEVFGSKRVKVIATFVGVVQKWYDRECREGGINRL